MNDLWKIGSEAINAIEARMVEGGRTIKDRLLRVNTDGLVVICIEWKGKPEGVRAIFVDVLGDYNCRFYSHLNSMTVEFKVEG